MPVVDFPPPYLVQFRGSRLARALLALMGWKIHFQGLPTRQGVAIAYPHTSNWDFPVMVLVKWATGIQACFWAKDSLFRIPVFSRWLRQLGGLPINRSAAEGVVESMLERFSAAQARDEYLWLGLSPEGTRRLTPGWRSGFYRVALGAQVPVALIRLDYGRREVCLDQFIRLSGDVEHDYARLREAFEQVRGYHPHQAAPIQPLPPSSQEHPSS